MDIKQNSSGRTLTADETARRVKLFSEILQCNNRIFVSRYNSSGALLETNAKNTIYDTMLRHSGRLDDALSFGRTSKYPLIITTDYGFMWSVVYEPDDTGVQNHLHILGPVLSTAISDETLKTLLRTPGIREKWKTKLTKYIRDIKVIPITEFFNQTLMLHYCISDQYIKISDITFLNFNYDNHSAGLSDDTNYANYWSMENTMIDFIKKGDIHYKEKIRGASSIFDEIEPLTHNDLTTIKQLASVFCGLCIRAAIDGGLSPDSAYSKGIIYLRNLADIKAVAEVMPICHNVFEDFLFQVHNHQAAPAYTKEISSCIDYIETHPNEPLGIDYLADRIGYSKYYLSKKFKSEVGCSINTYIKKARINKACYLLVTTKMSIESISESLMFGNRNFFTKIFKEETGTTPASFRDAHIKY